MNSAGDVALRLEGWISICDNSEQAQWKKRYCVLSQDDRRLRFFENKETVVVSSPVPVARLDNDEKEQQTKSKSSVKQALKPVDGSVRRQPSDHSDSEELKRVPNQSDASTSGFSKFRASLRNKRNMSKKSLSDKKEEEKKNRFKRSRSLTRGEGRHFSRQLVNSRQIGRSLDSLDNVTPFGDHNSFIDLASANPPVVRLCHPSIAPSEHCFDIIFGHAVVHCKCKEEEQMRVWVDSLKRCINWGRDNEAREDIDLTVWIMDVKGLAKKGKYHCELLLDSQVCARTTIKVYSESLFWGEHFYFCDVPPISSVTVKIHKEPPERKSDKKRKGGLVGTVEIKVAEITRKQGIEVEKWYPVTSTSQKQDGATMRVKARYQVVLINPLRVYNEFFQFLEERYSTLCEVLEPVIPAKSKDEIAQTLIRILHSGGKSRQFLLDIVMAEVEHLEDENLIFRGNTFATKAMDTYMKMVGDRYLKETLGKFIHDLYETEEECEVDPSRLPQEADLKTCQETLMLFVDKAWAKIVSSYTKFPTELQAVFHGFHQKLVGKKDNLKKKLISGSIFLRFFCPAILSPSLFHLVQAYPDEKTSRRLMLVAKVLQSLANFTRFGQKESYMFCMDEFFERELPNMYHYIEKISGAPNEEVVPSAHTNIDVGRELAIMHRILSDYINNLSPADVARIAPLSFILQSITNYSSESLDPVRSYSFPNLPDIMSSPLSFSNPLISVEDEHNGTSSSERLANQQHLSSLHGRHPSTLHAIHNPTSKSPAHTLPSNSERSPFAALETRRRSSPIIAAKIQQLQMQQYRQRQPSHGGIMVLESESDSSGSSGNEATGGKQSRRSLPYAPSVSLVKQTGAMTGNQPKMGKSLSAHPVFPPRHRRANSGQDFSSFLLNPSIASSQASLCSSVSVEELNQNQELHDRLSQSEMKVRLSTERELKLSADLKQTQDKLLSEQSAHEKEVNELRQELEKTQRLLAQQEERSNELSKSLKRVIESDRQVKKELREVRESLSSKQHLIMVQQMRMRGLGTANAKLMSGLNDLHRRSPLRGAMNGTAEASASPISPDLMEVIRSLQNPGGGDTP